MNAREITCIRCPAGCRLTVAETEGTLTVKGNECKLGEQYGRQEYASPMRIVTSSVRVISGARPLCPVKTAGEVRKADIKKVLAAIHESTVSAPVKIGQVIIKNVIGSGTDVVATRSIPSGTS